jgi:hypothetical protein
MTDVQKKFVELEKRKAEVKKYFEELEQATLELAKEIGVGGMFQDPEGTVYKVVIPEGTFVKFAKIGYQRTRRPGEVKGDLSLTEARERGFVVEGK